MAEVQEKAEQAAGQAQEKAKEAGHQARDRVREQVDQRSTEAGDRVQATACDVRSVAEELRKQGKDAPAKYAEQAADRAERAGEVASESDGDRILRDVEDFGRSKPWAVVAGGLALGFAASRLLKASSSERYKSSLGDSPSRSLPSGNGVGREHGASPDAPAIPDMPAHAGHAASLTMATGPNNNQELRERPTGELLKELSEQTTQLVRQEIDLAKAELTEKGKKAGVGAGMVGGAGLFGVFAFAALTACLIGALDTATPFWLAALIVAVVYSAVAGVLALRGKKQVQDAAPPVPEQALESTKEDVEWAKTRAKSSRT